MKGPPQTRETWVVGILPDNDRKRGISKKGGALVLHGKRVSSKRGPLKLVPDFQMFQVGKTFPIKMRLVEP